MSDDNEMTAMTDEQAVKAPPPGAAGGALAADGSPAGFMTDTKGNLIAEKNVSPTDKLMDQTVREIVKYAEDLSAQIGRFKEHTVSDMEAFLATIREHYGSTRTRGAKGNFSLTSYDGLLRVTDKSSDIVKFGPELQVAKELLDELLDEWGVGASSELRTIVQGAFETSKEGDVNRAAILVLRRYEFDHPKWPTVQKALADAERVLGRKSSIQIHKRDEPNGKWKLIPLDVASAGE